MLTQKKHFFRHCSESALPAAENSFSLMIANLAQIL